MTENAYDHEDIDDITEGDARALAERQDKRDALFMIGLVLAFLVFGIIGMLHVGNLRAEGRAMLDASRYVQQIETKYGVKVEPPTGNKLSGVWTVDGVKRECDLWLDPIVLKCEVENR